MKMFHPAVEDWFQTKFGEPSEPQRAGWPLIRSGCNTLISAPTGSGKTLAAFLCALDSMVRQGAEGTLTDTTQILYLSPLKALANDVQKNLLEPLSEIRQRAEGMGLEIPEIRPLVRSGDTRQHERRQMVLRHPHILVTTPESFFILLTSVKGREMLEAVRTVIVDEIHALARDKRGSHLALSLERLEVLAGRPLQRIGLSATQKPIEAVAQFLVGPERPVSIVDVGHRREMDVRVEVPRDELSSVASAESWQEIYERLTELIHAHRTTLIFVNTRRLAERVAHHISERIGTDAVATHHGSLSRKTRLLAEERLKQGELKAIVATASLELGIDIGTVDCVCQIGTPRSIGLALQRIGRSGHWKGAIPKGRIFATTRDELLECAALVREIRLGRLDRIIIPEAPLDILAQQIIAASAAGEWDEEELYQTFRRSGSYQNLSREDYDQILEMLSEGISTRQGRRKAYLHRDRINSKIRGRRGARLAAITSGGSIPDNADFLVKADPDEVIVGTLDEDFAIESMKGDIFLLGNTSWRIRRVESGVVRVEDAQGAPPSIPFWRGEAPGRTDELSSAFSELREKVLELGRLPGQDWLMKHCGLDHRGASQAVEYVFAGKEALGVLPTQQCIVAERFFDQAGGMQLILHTPFGIRINRAWGLALRKRFCRSFNFELQAAATDNGLLLSLSDQHSFPLESAFSFLTTKTVTRLLTQALLDVPMFATRWRWNASRALAILRFSRGRKVPPQLQRMRSDDLLAAVFPEQAACLENIQGDIEIPDHPLVQETLRDCLQEAMDLEGLLEVLAGVEAESIRCAAVDTREPSPFSHEVLNANAYAFLDDAPLEERRARAVQTPRGISSSQLKQFGSLDIAAIEQVRNEVEMPSRTPDEVHDWLLTMGVVGAEDLADRGDQLATLVEDGRAFKFKVSSDDSTSGEPGRVFWAATEKLMLVRKVYSGAEVGPELDSKRRSRLASLWERDAKMQGDEAARELVRARMESESPLTSVEIADRLGMSKEPVDRALAALESEGQILRGNFRQGLQETEWCERRLLARMHRLTLGRLRREIEPVSPAEFMRFLFNWQHVAPGTRLHGETGVALVLRQLQGFETAAAAWEKRILDLRVKGFESEQLDAVCLSGQFVWGRLSKPAGMESGNHLEKRSRNLRPTRIAPITFLERQHLPYFLKLLPDLNQVGENGRKELPLSHPAREVLEQLRRWGASFMPDLVRTTGRLPLEVEEGLWELVNAGLVTADGFDNLRGLIDPKRRLATRHRRKKRKRKILHSSMGRWTLLEPPGEGARENGNSGDTVSPGREPQLETLARQLLDRWGVVFRDLLARETLSPAWRDLLQVYRRLEARGEVRGGRFVAGFVGEQFALPDAVDLLRSLRRRPGKGEIVRVSAADPLNLVGILTPGGRIRPHPETVLLFKDGVPVDDLEGAEAS